MDVNLLLGCDGLYYQMYGINFIHTLKRHAAFLKIHIVVVNPTSNINQIKDVNYIFEIKTFSTDEEKIGYLQCVRFLKCNELFPNSERVITMDVDTLCNKNITEEKILSISESIHVLKFKEKWLAGLVSFGNLPHFRQALQQELSSVPQTSWRPGFDQLKLRELEKRFLYNPVNVGSEWVTFNSRKFESFFTTFKGERKFNDSFYSECLTKSLNTDEYKYQQIMKDLQSL
jgi:hypothetical protein